jgi:hypothetical protein
MFTFTDYPKLYENMLQYFPPHWIIGYIEICE